LSSPLDFIEIAALPESKNCIDYVYKVVAGQCGKPGSFDASSVKIHRVKVKIYPCVVIELPEPKEITGAFLLALVLPVDLSANEPHYLKSLSGRYFTLEKARSCANEQRTMLVEWYDAKHLNYGFGPPPNVQAFVEAISRYV
jgi:hypothetical protein